MFLGAGNKEAGRVYIYTLSGVSQRHGCHYSGIYLCILWVPLTTTSNVPMSYFSLPFSHPPLLSHSSHRPPPQDETFVYNGTLKAGEKAQDARFGYALASTSDLNNDGYTDLLVGAPLEEGHKGAIYIYHGDVIRIIPTYKQVGKGAVGSNTFYEVYRVAPLPVKELSNY